MSRAQTARMAGCGGAVMYFGFLLDLKRASGADVLAMAALATLAAWGGWVLCPGPGVRPRDRCVS